MIEDENSHGEMVKCRTCGTLLSACPGAGNLFKTNNPKTSSDPIAVSGSHLKMLTFRQFVNSI